MTSGLWRAVASLDRGLEPFLAGAIVLVAIYLLSGSSSLDAQFSPGVLSQPHSELDDSAHCLECHGSGKGVNRDRCLSCHQDPGRSHRFRVGTSCLRQISKRCETCHIEHHGKDFELIWWGDEGRQSFRPQRNRLSTVEGAHANLTCEKCHSPQKNPTKRSAPRARKESRAHLSRSRARLSILPSG